jgi:hypothetical protein
MSMTQFYGTQADLLPVTGESSDIYPSKSIGDRMLTACQCLVLGTTALHSPAFSLSKGHNISRVLVI